MSTSIRPSTDMETKLDFIAGKILLPILVATLAVLFLFTLFYIVLKQNIFKDCLKIFNLDSNLPESQSNQSNQQTVINYDDNLPSYNDFRKYPLADANKETRDYHENQWTEIYPSPPDDPPPIFTRLLNSFRRSFGIRNSSQNLKINTAPFCISNSTNTILTDVSDIAEIKKASDEDGKKTNLKNSPPPYEVVLNTIENSSEKPTNLSEQKSNAIILEPQKSVDKT